MSASSKWSALGAKVKEKEVIAIGEVALGAAASAALNMLKPNCQRGTNALMVKADGTGGIDTDLAVGGAMIALGLLAPVSLRSAAPHMLAIGTGLASGFVGREAATLTHNHQLTQQAAAIGNLNAGQSVSGVPGLNLVGAYGFGY